MPMIPWKQIERALCLTVLLAWPIPSMPQDFLGVVHPLRGLTLSMGVGGIITHVDVKAGDWIKTGKTLLVLDEELQRIEAERRKMVWEDQSELKATIEQLRILKELLNDARALYKQSRSISRDDLYKLELEYIATNGQLEKLRVQEQRERLEYLSADQERKLRVLTAPIAGVITKLELDVGEWVNPGEPIMQMVDASTCILRVSVPEPMAKSLRLGMRLPVYVSNAMEAPLDGEVTFVSPVADPASGLVELKITFANSQLLVRPGAQARISLSTDIVPVSGQGNSGILGVH